MTEIPDLQAAVEKLAEAKQVILACHIGPDGDAIGSMLGLAWTLRRYGKEVVCSFGEPFKLPDNYRFLPLELLVPPAEIPEEVEVMVTLDAASEDRLGSLLPAARRARTLIVVDHHGSNSGFGHLNLIVPDAAATAEVVFQMIQALGWDVDDVAASCLLLGIVTDTGRFQYSNTAPSTLRVAAELVEAGARPEIIGRHIFEETEFGYLQVAGAVLSRAVLDIEHRLVWSVLTLADLEEFGISIDETELLIDAIRTAREAEVALLVKESQDGKVKGSMRSRGEIDVSAIAFELGGGGHHNAAGVTFDGTVEQLVAEVTGRLPTLGPETA